MLSYKSVHLDSTASPAYAVLLLHAFPLSSEMWASQLSMLEEREIPAIAPDVFGVEGSEPRETWVFRDYVEEISSLLSLLRIKSVTVVGLSMGGYQAFEFWRMFPEKVSSLVLCDTRAEQDNEDALANRRDQSSNVIRPHQGPRGVVNETGRRLLPDRVEDEQQARGAVQAGEREDGDHRRPDHHMKPDRRSDHEVQPRHAAGNHEAQEQDDQYGRPDA